jgi:hypothetical protein
MLEETGQRPTRRRCNELKRGTELHLKNLLKGQDLYKELLIEMVNKNLRPYFYSPGIVLLKGRNKKIRVSLKKKLWRKHTVGKRQGSYPWRQWKDIDELKLVLNTRHLDAVHPDHYKEKKDNAEEC